MFYATYAVFTHSVANFVIGLGVPECRALLKDESSSASRLGSHDPTPTADLRVKCVSLHPA